MTLVEIMITMIISSIIAASTFMFFAGQQRIYETQTKLLNIQQNLWASMEILTRYTRAAGGGMFECVRPANYSNGSGGRSQNQFPSAGPLTVSLAAAPAAGVRAYDATNSAAQWIPPLWIVDNASVDSDVLQNTDVLTVAFGSQTSGTDTDVTLGLAFGSADPGTPITLSVATGSNMFRAGEFVLLLTSKAFAYGYEPNNDRGCSMFQITNYAANASTLQHQSTAVSEGMVWNPPGDTAGMLVAGGYAAGDGVRNFGTLTWVRFYIQQDATTGIPNLMMRQLHRGGDAGKPQVLAEGIEDLQVSFACDTGNLGGVNLAQANGQLDEGTDPDIDMKTDEWWNNVPNDTLPSFGDAGFCNLPTAIRLTLVARTLTQDDLIDPLSLNGPMDIENHVYTTRPVDRYRRRVLSTTVYPRNNKPL
jgi:Tfp pilus assembly protein PilW